MVEFAAEFPTIRVSGRWLVLAALICCAAIFVTGCGGRQPVAAAPPPTNTTPEPAPSPEPGNRPAASSPAAGTPKPHEGGNVYEEGKASWYGAPFHGRQASNGETYDMYKFTAAHRTLPFNTMVRVTNVTNGKSTTVRITDRGPFVDNRIIDLSYAAAKQIESIGPGVVTVQLEILSAIDPNEGTFTIQVGAFHDRGNAERLQARLKAAYPSVEIQSFDSPKGESFYRVHVGKISGEDAAKRMSEELHAREGVKPLIFRVDNGAAPGEN
ncbi:MAG TPA: septal ring lytic transglycosylase RlpA family protein [Candidatus Eremiobacteraceae bacterium]|jgi:rare lipoprotein A|nr:septal ring lytic transglycosylase RlpA family protein [Candidatus Eremiobacteraceae bacterium]